MVSRAVRAELDELAWLVSTCSIDIDELMTASSPPAIERGVVDAAGGWMQSLLFPFY